MISSAHPARGPAAQAPTGIESQAPWRILIRLLPVLPDLTGPRAIRVGYGREFTGGPGRRRGMLGPAYLDGPGTDLACSLKPNSFLYHNSLEDLRKRPSGKRRGPTTSREVRHRSHTDAAEFMLTVLLKS